MERLAGEALSWLNAYTFAAVFVLVLIDASGLPFPGRLLLAAAGALMRDSYRSMAIVIVLAAAAAIVMDTAWYVAGRHGGERLVALYRKLPGWRGRRRADATADYFAQYGAATIVIGRFFMSVRAFAWPVAATRGVGYGKFLALDIPAALLWAALWVSLGASVGTGWRAAAETAGGWLAVGGAILVAGVAAMVAMHLRRRRASQ